MTLDIRTILLIGHPISLLLVIVTLALWLQNRKQYTGIHLWFIGMLLRAIGSILIGLRNVIPDFLSILIGNFSFVAAWFIIYMGLERFVARPRPQLHNYIFLGAFACFFTYFTYFQPNVAIRIALYSAILIVLFAESAWLLLHQVESNLKPITRATGIIYLLYAFIQCCRIVISFQMFNVTDYMDTNTLDAILQTINLILGIALVFALSVMVNHRMVNDILDNEEKLVRTKVELEISKRESDDLKRAEERLRESESKYRLLVENANEAIVVAQDGLLKFANPRAADLTGYSYNELTSMPFTQLILPDDREMVLERHLQRLKGETPPEIYQFRVARKDGTVGWADINTVLIIWENKPATLNLLTDITKRKRAEDALQQSEVKYHSLFDFAGDAILLMEDAKFTDCNPKALEMFGCTKEQLCGKPPYHFSPDIQPDGSNSKVKAVRLVTEAYQGKPQFFEWKHRRFDGVEFDAEVSLNLIEIENKKYLLAIVRDVTERKRANNALELNSQRIKTLLQLNQMTNATLRDITNFALEEAVRLTQSKIGYLAFLNEDESILTMHSWSKSAMAECEINEKPIKYPVVTTGLWGEAVRQRKSVITNDYAATNLFKKGYPQGHVVIKRHMNTPVFAGDRIVLVAGVGNKANDYDDSDIHQLTLLMEGMWGLIERKRTEQNLQDAYTQLKKNLDSTILTISKIVEMRDPYTAGHQQRVAKLSIAISKEMHLESKQFEQLNMAAIIHDIGKINVPAEILSKPGKLTELEFRIIKTHAQNGYDILRNMDFAPEIAQIVLQHHERLDGSGYPNNLKGEEILLGAKIISVADVVEAIASNRPYRPALGIDKALAEISNNEGKLYGPHVVDACLRLFNQKGFKFD